MEKTLEKLNEILVTSGLSIVKAILVLIIGFKLGNFIIKLIKKGKGFNKLERGVQTFLLSFLNIAIKIVVIISACTILGIPMTTIIALLSSCALAIGLSLQGSLSNLAGGLMILLFKPFKVGDYIDTHSDAGTVLDITMFYTTLVTVDNKEIILPNGTLSNTSIINYSKMPKRRIDLIFTTSYKNNIDKVKKIINQVISKQELVLDEEKFVRLSKHGDSYLEFTVRVWVKTNDYFTVYYDLLEQVKVAFDKNDIEIPYPQLDVHLDK